MGSYYLKKPVFIFGASLLTFSMAALVVLILFWPQSNPRDVVKLSVKAGETLGDISQRLFDKKVISNQRMFRWAVQLMGKETEIPVGTFKLVDANSNYKIIEQLVYGSPEIKKVRLLEGWSVEQIADQINKVMGLSKDEILSLSNDYRFLKNHDIQASSIEGYLFPDTYHFFDGDTPHIILSNLVDEYKKFWNDERRHRADELGLSEHDVVTLASIIEGEAIYDSERPTISAVYHNRLNIGMRLQADPTIQYIIDDGPRRLLNRDLRIKSPYNTYLHEGLPPGPINSPGEESLLAALYPEENEYLFFVAKGDGYHTFTKNEEEHNRAKKKFQKIRREVKRKNGKNEYKKIK